MKNGSSLPPRPTSPVHVHIDECTPVHVHIKKRKKPCNNSKKASSNCNSCLDCNSIIGRAARGRPRSVSPCAKRRTKTCPRPCKDNPYYVPRASKICPPAPVCHTGPWIPPPAKTTRRYRSRASSEGSSGGRGKCVTDCDDNPCEPDTDEEEMGLGRIRDYEHKIGCLTSELARLKCELQKCNGTDEECSKTDSCISKTKIDRLLKTLREIETEGEVVLSQTTGLRDIVLQLSDPCVRVNNAQSQALANRALCLLDKLCAYEDKSRKLRDLLCDQRNSQASMSAIIDERDALLTRLKEMKVEEELIHDKIQHEAETAGLNKDKEDLKKAARTHKEKACKAQEALEAAYRDLRTHKAVSCDQKTELESLRCRFDRLNQEKCSAQVEADGLKRRINELECLVERMAKDTSLDVSGATVRLDDKQKQICCLKTERDKIQTLLRTAEDRLSRSDKELAQLRCTVRDYETLVDDYRTQVKDRLESRLEELEPMPDQLRSIELRLQQTVQELNETRQQYAAELQLVRQQLVAVQAELQRECESQKRDSLLSVVEIEESLTQANLQIDELTRENVCLQRQHEDDEAKIKRLTCKERDKTSDKEKASRSKILDMESQLKQCQHVTTRLKREKDENERQMRAQLYDVNQRLDQSHRTNRSLQTYVQFLKNSYATVFGDPVNIPAGSSCP